MKILLYDNTHEKFGESLHTLIKEKFPGPEVILLNTMADIQSALCRPLHRIGILIFFADSDGELVALKTFMPLLENTRTILVLPDRAHETLAMAVQVKAAFITYSDNEFTAILSVLNKLINK